MSSSSSCTPPHTTMAPPTWSSSSSSPHQPHHHLRRCLFYALHIRLDSSSSLWDLRVKLQRWGVLVVASSHLHSRSPSSWSSSPRSLLAVFLVFFSTELERKRTEFPWLLNRGVDPPLQYFSSLLGPKLK